MKDNYGFQQSGGSIQAEVLAAGQKASATKNVTGGAEDAARLKQLADELQQLRSAMAAQRDDSPEKDMAIGAVAGAQAAASRGDRDGTMAFLKQAGKWALETATAIGTPIAEAMIKSSMGL